jgi:hypothetical protein
MHICEKGTIACKETTKMNLWNLITGRAVRRYALLDARGNCLALRESRHAPKQDGWVEVNEIRLCWLGQHLPQEALAQSPAANPQALAA